MATYRLAGWEITVAPQAEFASLPFLPHQVHGGTIVDLCQSHDAEPGADGLLINQQQYAGIKTADCLPLVLLTPDQALLLHVSRKTVLANQLDQVSHYISLPDIQAVFWGPHICETHFIFEHEGTEITAFKKRWPQAVRQDAAGVHLSLDIVVQTYLEQWEVPANIMTYDQRCTFETPELPSYRRLFHAQQLKQMSNIITAVRFVGVTERTV